MGLFLGSGSGSKKFVEPTYVDNQLWFWMYSPIFLGAIFGVGARFKNFFGTYLHLSSLKLSRVVGLVGGWVVGNSDFDENPVVSLDLDLGLRLRVCQKIM